MIYCLAIRHTKSETKTGIYRFWASHFPVSRFWEKAGNSKPYFLFYEHPDLMKMLHFSEEQRKLCHNFAIHVEYSFGIEFLI